MQIQQASRQLAKIKMALQGPSGSGKTMGALLIAYGLCESWNKIVVIDTENHSANLYAHLGPYNVLNIGAPFTPEKYMDAIKLCESSGMEVIILDSISHEWEGSGGILDIHSSMAGNSFTNWGKLTPRHNAFVQAILQSHCHIIGTVRSKQDYVLNEKNGKMVPEKVGLKGVTRDDMSYEFTLVFDVDVKHFASASKDRTGLFGGKPEFRITPATGMLIADWCSAEGEVSSSGTEESQIATQIGSCNTMEQLISLFKQQPASTQKEYSQLFSRRKQELQRVISSLPKPSSNGAANHKQG